MLFVNREKFAGEKIPTLEEAVEECVQLQLTIYFDVKGHPDEVQPANNKLLSKVQARQRLLVIYSVASAVALLPLTRARIATSALSCNEP